MTEPIDISTPAGFWLRVGAKFCDWALIFAAQFVVLWLFVGADALSGGLSPVWMLGTFGLFAVLQIVYFGWGNARGRRTPGYRWAGLRLETLQGQPLSLGRNLGRALLSNAASSLLVYGGFIDFLPIFGRQRRAGHDFLCGTRVLARDAPRQAVLQGLPAALLLFLMLWTSHVVWLVPLRVYFIPAGSMEPTLGIGDRMMVNLLAYRVQAPRDGEIAIFNAPAAALLDSADGPNQQIDFVKRVVGTPGQRVEIVHGQLRVDGQRVSEPFAKWKEGPLGDLPPELDADRRYDMKIVAGAIYSREYLAPDEPGHWTKNSVEVGEEQQKSISAARAGVVPPDQFLMLGDHRSNSNDSHVWGFASREAFVGRAMNVFWPTSRWKTLR